MDEAHAVRNGTGRKPGIPFDGPWPSVLAWGSKWNECAARYKLPMIEKPSDKRCARIRRALKTFPAEDEWDVIYANYGKSRYLRGEMTNLPKPDADWLLASHKTRGTENFVRVFEGAYTELIFSEEEP